MARTNNGYPDDILFERASKFNRRSDLRKYDNKVYQALWRRNLLDKACVNMEESLTDAYTIEELCEEAKKYSTKMEFRKYNRGMYDATYRRGLIPVVCPHMPKSVSLVPGDNHPLNKWTVPILKKIAQKYSRKIDFYNNEPKAYAAAYIRGYLDDICSEMEIAYHSWTVDEIVRVFKLCSSRGEVQKKFSRAYQAAREKGVEFLDSVSSHFKKTGGSSIAEREILAIVKSYLNEAKKMPRSRVNVPDKPFIKSFEIDVYVTSLKRGIEYDGTRYHSFEYMRKDRRKKLWSDSDIRNYHEIKDMAFLSKGITILHIKEEDWESDKLKCIGQIKKFLDIGE